MVINLPLLLFLLFLLPTAKSPTNDTKVIQPFANGQVDWTEGEIIVEAVGRPDFGISEVHARRIQAEVVAKNLAVGYLMTIIEGLHVDGERSAGILLRQEALRRRVEKALGNYVVVDTKYFADGGVNVFLQLSLGGNWFNQLLGRQVFMGSLQQSERGGTGITGVIVNARALNPLFALCPRLLSESGSSIFLPCMQKMERISIGQSRAMVSYHKNLKAAFKNKRIRGKPLIVKAVRLSEPDGVDLVLSAEDAAAIDRIRDEISAGHFAIIVD